MTHNNFTMNKNKQTIVRQGDVDMLPLSMTSLTEIPKNTVHQKDGVVMHGESGHKHRLGSNAQLLVLDGDEPVSVTTDLETTQASKFLHVPEMSQITHEEHTTLNVPPGDYVVLQEREMDHMDQIVKNTLD